MPAHKVFVPVALVPTDHDCAKLEGYSLLLYSDKGLHLCAVESFFFINAFDCFLLLLF